MGNKIIKGYKGFDKDMKCRGLQYEIGKEMVVDKAELCNCGLHFCENPNDVFRYYGAGNGNKFAVVEATDVSDEHEVDSKRVAKRLTVKAEISVFKICKIAVSTFFENFGFKEKIKGADSNNAGDCGAANAGDCGAANAGDCGAANAGSCGAANAGSCGAANAGSCGAANAGSYGAANAGSCGAANAGSYGAANAGSCGVANAGSCGAANAGSYGAANAGRCGAANAGSYGAANAGDCGAANAGSYGAANAGRYGAANAGRCGAAIVSTYGRVKGGIGCILVARDIEWNEDNDSYEVIDWAAEIVDGDKIKADTWYHLENGKLVECEKDGENEKENQKDR